MGDRTRIEWCEATWSPVTGCTRASEGCTRCYIDRTPPLRMARRRFNGEHIGATTGVMLHPERLTIPLRWRRPRRIFVCSLADLWHDEVPDSFIAQVFAVMALAPQHTYQCLTKRHARLRSLMNSAAFRVAVLDAAYLMIEGRVLPSVAAAYRERMGAARRGDIDSAITWPLPNVWLGVSTENQRWADVRIPALLSTPAAVRWVSAEPLLGPVDLTRVDGARTQQPGMVYDALGQRYGVPGVWQAQSTARVDWVVAGGESGPGSRPMHPDWARSLRDQCAAAGVPFLFKQHGDWVDPGQIDCAGWDDAAMGERGLTVWPDGRQQAGPAGTCTDGSALMWRVGKHRAGRVLDGRVWDGYPQPAAAVA